MTCFDDFPLVDHDWIKKEILRTDDELSKEMWIETWLTQAMPSIWPNWERIEALVEQADWAPLKEAVHSLINSVCYFGLARIVTILREWEENFSDPEAARLFRPLGKAVLRDSLAEMERCYPVFFPSPSP